MTQYRVHVMTKTNGYKIILNIYLYYPCNNINTTFQLIEYTAGHEGYYFIKV